MATAMPRTRVRWTLEMLQKIDKQLLRDTFWKWKAERDQKIKEKEEKEAKEKEEQERSSHRKRNRKKKAEGVIAAPECPEVSASSSAAVTVTTRMPGTDEGLSEKVGQDKLDSKASIEKEQENERSSRRRRNRKKKSEGVIAAPECPEVSASSSAGVTVTTRMLGTDEGLSAKVGQDKLDSNASIEKEKEQEKERLSRRRRNRKKKSEGVIAAPECPEVSASSSAAATVTTRMLGTDEGLSVKVGKAKLDSKASIEKLKMTPEAIAKKAAKLTGEEEKELCESMEGMYLDDLDILTPDEEIFLTNEEEILEFESILNNLKEKDSDNETGNQEACPGLDAIFDELYPEDPDPSELVI